MATTIEAELGTVQPRTRSPRTLGWRIASALGQTVLVMWGAATLSFATLYFLPGDPVDILLGNDPNASAEIRDQIRQFYGLDQPVFMQYLSTLWRALHGDLGQSFQLFAPVWTVITDELLPTAQLALAATLIAVVVSPVLAVVTSGRSRWVCSASSTLELLAISTPSFWLGLLLLTVFSYNLRWFPLAADQGLRSLVLPALTLSLSTVGTLTQLIRATMEDVLGQPFVLTARARGLSDLAVRVRHVLRHASLPALTLSGQFLGNLLGGAVITEAVFGRPGIGRLTLQAINGKDIPVITGVVLVSALAFVVTSQLVELLYPRFDPRLRTPLEH